MRKSKLVFLLLAVFSIAILTSGCLQTGIVMDFSPNPIIISSDMKTIKGELKIRLYGHGIINIENIVFSFLDRDEKNIIKPFKLELNSSLPISASNEVIPVEIPIDYLEIKMSGLTMIRIQITGQKTHVLDIPIQLIDNEE